MLILALCVGAIALTRWIWIRHSLAWHIDRALTLLAEADTPTRVHAALDRWEREAGSAREQRADDLVTLLCKDYPLEDQRVRLLLAHISGADYGDRKKDWARWHEAQRRLRAGKTPEVSRREAVRLEKLWEARIGLTAWFSTIVSLDGTIFVASLGADFDDPQDEADGVVQVDGASGTSSLFFTPPSSHRGPRDVIGLAAGDEGLFVACRNGSVYYVTARGEISWGTHAGDPVVAPPLAVDTNHDGVMDVVVVTREANIVALSGRSGKTTWVTRIAQPSVNDEMVGATLALGDVLAGDDQELIATTPLGNVHVLSVRSGKTLWTDRLAAGTVAGIICRPGPPSLGPRAFVADRAARVWALADAGESVELVQTATLALREADTLIAGLRSIVIDPEQPPFLIACPTGDYLGHLGGVCVLDPDGIRWRLGIDGAIWATPAVADLNGDGNAEIVVTSIGRPTDDQVAGVLSVLSSTGHCLKRVSLPAPVECSPVVADVDGDAYLEVLVAEQSGRLHCFGTGIYGPVQWGMFGGDSHNTRNQANAFAFGQAPFGYQWQWRPE